VAKVLRLRPSQIDDVDGLYALLRSLWSIVTCSTENPLAASTLHSGCRTACPAASAQEAAAMTTDSRRTVASRRTSLVGACFWGPTPVRLRLNGSRSVRRPETGGD
jgi:hypothetical protein